MPTCTPIYGYTYPIGSDAPCDVDETLCAFATEVEVDLTRLDDLVDRTVTSVPQFEVAISEPYVQSVTGSSIAFDTVRVDTDNMVDLAADPFTFTLSRTGRWFLYFRVAMAGNIAVDLSLAAAVAYTPSTLNIATPGIQYNDTGANYPVDLNASGVMRLPAAGQQVSLTCNTGANVVAEATFGAYWLGDI